MVSRHYKNGLLKNRRKSDGDSDAGVERGSNYHGIIVGRCVCVIRLTYIRTLGGKRKKGQSMGSTCAHRLTTGKKNILQTYRKNNKKS